MTDQTIFVGDVRKRLRELPIASVQCCVTSPPYWSLRDYQVSGQIGLEPTMEEYIAVLVDVFSEVRRVLRDDGTLWLNIGDCYTPQSTHKANDVSRGGGFNQLSRSIKNETNMSYGKPKDLMGMPWRLAFALQSDGWWIRSEVVWAKGVSFCDSYSGSVMPESVTDRPTCAHEKLFLLTKSKTYYYDCEAVKERSVSGEDRKPYAPGQVDGRGNGHDRGGGRHTDKDTTTRNLRNVWAINNIVARLRHDLDPETRARVITELVNRGLL